MRTDQSFTCPYGVLEQVSPQIRRIVARNPGPFTFRGTGTYVVGRGQVAVIDPGPDLPEHVDALLAALSGESVTHILVTHTHRDHSPAAAALKAAVEAPTFGFGPHAAVGAFSEAGVDRDFTPDIRMDEGDAVEGPGWRLEALHTPGHTSNHLCFALPQERALFSGDHVMGWSTTVIAPPDGNMTHYMESLARLLARDDRTYWPTHGGPIADPAAHVRDLRDHRIARRTAVLAALDTYPRRPSDLVPAIYGALDPRLVMAAAASILAHLIELAEVGDAVAEDEGWRRA